MVRLFKPARSKSHGRGLFSYLTESVINLSNYIDKHAITDIKYYHDLEDIPGYGEGNLFNKILLQDVDDFNKYKSEYTNVESTPNVLNLDCYKPFNYSETTRKKTEFVVNNFFIPNENLSSLIDNRHKEINFEVTVGVHRRATDISNHHKIIDLQTVFHNIELEDFENVFLMCDNVNDKKNFKDRYGNKLITYDEFTSNDINLPFFLLENNPQIIQNHIEELMFGVLTLSKTKKFICSVSNLSSFSILSNAKLNCNILF